MFNFFKNHEQIFRFLLPKTAHFQLFYDIKESVEWNKLLDCNSGNITSI